MDDEVVTADDEGEVSWKSGGSVVDVGSVPTRGIGIPTAGKSASLTFRLVLRVTQPITMSKCFLAASSTSTSTWVWWPCFKKSGHFGIIIEIY